MQALVDEYIDQLNCENTRLAYRQDLNKWFTYLADRAPTRRIVIDYRLHLEANYAARTAARAFNTARAFYRWVDQDVPFRGVNAPKRLRNAQPEVPADLIIDDMLMACDNSRDKAVIALCLNGLRASEVCGLTPKDWRFEPKYGCYVINVIGKGNKQRTVPANRETTEAVNDVIRLDKPYVVLSLDGGQMTRRQVEQRVVYWSSKCGMSIYPHALRHHYATRLVRAGVSVFALKELLGHESVATTQVYVRMDYDDIVLAASKDPRNKE